MIVVKIKFAAKGQLVFLVVVFSLDLSVDLPEKWCQYTGITERAGNTDSLCL